MLWHIYLVEKCNDNQSNISPTYTNSGNWLRSHPARRRIPSCEYFHHYLNDLKNKLVAEGYSEVSENIGQMKKKLLQDGYDQLSENIGQLKIEVYEKIVLLKMAQKTEHGAFSVNTDRRRKP